MPTLRRQLLNAISITLDITSSQIMIVFNYGDSGLLLSTSRPLAELSAWLLYDRPALAALVLALALARQVDEAHRA